MEYRRQNHAADRGRDEAERVSIFDPYGSCWLFSYFNQLSFALVYTDKGSGPLRACYHRKVCVCVCVCMSSCLLICFCMCVSNIHAYMCECVHAAQQLLPSSAATERSVSTSTLAAAHWPQRATAPGTNISSLVVLKCLTSVAGSEFELDFPSNPPTQSPSGAVAQTHHAIARQILGERMACAIKRLAYSAGRLQPH